MNVRIGTCLLCFAENTKIFDIKNAKLQSVYEDISDSKIQNDCHCLCYICRAKLHQCHVLIKQMLNLQKEPQDHINEIEDKSLVRLTTIKLDNSSFDGVNLPNSVSIKQEPNDNEEKNSNYGNEEHIDSNINVKCEVPTEACSTSYSELTQHTTGLQQHIESKTPAFEDEEVNMHKQSLDRETSELKKKYKCDICDKEFNHSYSLKAHKMIHTGENPYSCDICDKKFKQNSNLKSHKMIHTGEKPYSCSICDKKFIQNSNLKKHKLIHTGEKPYSCHFCDKKFNNSSSLQAHIRAHSEEKPYSCDFCDKKYRHRNNLRVHLRTHTSKPYSCNICNKKFKCFCGKEPLFSCNKIFTGSAGLKTYMTHTGQKPFSCDICDEKFRHNSSLKLHRRIHTGEQPYS